MIKNIRDFILIVVISYAGFVIWEAFFPAGTEVTEAVDGGVIQVEARGKGLQRVQVTVNSSSAMRVVIPAGTLFRSGNSSVQNMISAQRIVITFKGAGQQSVEVPAYCINRFLYVPGGNDRLTITKSSDSSPLVRLADCLANQDAEHMDKQRAVWLVSDDLWSLSPEQLHEKLAADARKKLDSEYSIDGMISNIREIKRQMGEPVSEEKLEQMRSIYESVGEEQVKRLMFEKVYLPGIRHEIQTYQGKGMSLLRTCGFSTDDKPLFAAVPSGADNRFALDFSGRISSPSNSVFSFLN